MAATDAALLTKWIRRRDAQAFAELVARHAGMVFGTSRRILRNNADAEEIAQECFVALSQTHRPMERSVGGWLHRVATNRSISRLRDDSRRTTREHAYATSTSRETEVQWDDLREHVDEAIAAIADDLSTPVILYFFEGQSHREIARALGISRSGTTRRIGRGIDAVRDELKKRGITFAAATLTSLLEAHGASAAPDSLVAAVNRFAVAAPGVSRRARRPVLPALAAGVILVSFVAGGAAVLFSARSKSTPGVPENRAQSEARPNVPQEAAPEVPVEAAPILVAQSEIDTAPTDTPPPSGFTVRCVDESGSPVKGAEVFWERREILTPQLSYRLEDTIRVNGGPEISDADGYLTIPLDITDLLIDNVWVSGHARLPGKLASGFAASERWVDDESERTIHMVESATLRGTVIVPKGYPIENVSVHLQNYMSGSLSGPLRVRLSVRTQRLETLWPESFSTTPNADGTFELLNMPRNSRVTLGATGTGLGYAQAIADPQADASKNIITLEREAAIEGTVRYFPGGAPAADVYVYARPSGGPRNPKIVNTHAYPAQTDASGRFRIGGLMEAEYAVAVQSIGDPPEWVAAVAAPVPVVQGDVTEGIDLVLERGALVEGRVLTSKDGLPVSGAKLAALHPAGAPQDIRIGTAETDADGRFRFRFPPGDTHVYFFSLEPGYVYPRDQGKRIIRVTPKDSLIRDVNFYVEVNEEEAPPLGEATATGRIVNAAGEPLANVPIVHEWKYMQGAAERSMGGEIGRSSENGTFAVTFFCQGEHRVGAGGDGFSYVLGEPFTTEPDDTHDVGEIVLVEQTMTMTLRVLDPNGNPIDAAVVGVGGEGYRDPLQFRRFTDEDGIVEITKLPETEVHVSVHKQGFASYFESLMPGFEYEITLEPGESRLL